MSYNTASDKLVLCPKVDAEKWTYNGQPLEPQPGYEKCGSNNVIIGYKSGDSDTINTYTACTVVGPNSSFPIGAKNATIIGGNVRIPEGYPIENAVYIGDLSCTLNILGDDYSWNEAAKKIEAAYQRVCSTPLDRVYVPINGQFKTLGDEIVKMQAKLDIIMEKLNL